MRYYELISVCETTIPGHMGIDLVIDTSINPTEILAQYKNTDYDLEKTLGKLETFNASWRFIIKQKGRDEALALLRKIIKKN